MHTLSQSATEVKFGSAEYFASIGSSEAEPLPERKAGHGSRVWRTGKDGKPELVAHETRTAEGEKAWEVHIPEAVQKLTKPSKKQGKKD